MGACAAVSVLALLACAEAASGMAMAGRRATLSLQPARIRSPLRLRGGAPAGRKVLDEACHTLESHKNNKKGTISLEVAKNADKSYECTITSTIPGPVWLHWGFASRGAGWKAPPDQYLPPDTKKIDDKAVQSPFKDNKIVLKVSDKDAPDALAFVVKCDEPEEWFNGPGGDFWMDFKPMDPNCIGKMIIQRETEATHWSILDRMRLVNENIKGVAESDDGLAWIYTILRFNVMKLVGISRRSNYQSKDLAHTQKTVTENIASVYGRYPEARMWMRLMAATVPRGGGNGDAVRLEILDIMRRNGFKEGHRPGIEDHFIEQWHQKLHTNCAPDDLIIADAYIRFLETGNQDDYWAHLHGNGLSFEYMKALGGGMGSARSGLDGMTASPGHYPHILNDIKHLKWTLMQLHGGQDLDFLVMKAAGGLDGETNALLNEIKDNRHEWWINSKITEARKKLAGYIDTPAGHRDALLVDVFLENWFKVQIDKADLGSMAQDDLINSVQLALENVALSYGEPFWGALRQLQKANAQGDRWSVNWARTMKASVERCSLALSSYMDKIHTLVQPKAVELGTALKTDEAYLTNFGEEVVRGLPGFALSKMLTLLDQKARAAAQMGAWEMVSSVTSAVGTASSMADIVGIQGQTFEQPQVIFAQHVGGVEDIPPGVTAIITRSSMDILSHIAIRARNQNVLLATCHDDATFESLKANTGAVTVSVNAAGDVTVAAGGDLSSGGKAGGASKTVTVKEPTPCAKMCLVDTEFTTAHLGGKSNNLQEVRKHAAKLPANVKLPQSVALPFGTCEKVMADAANAELATQIKDLEKTLKGSQADAPVLEEIRDAVMGLTIPEALTTELEAACKTAGFPTELTADMDLCTEAAKAVWASKWGERAAYSRNAAGVPHSALQMAVLVQKVVNSQYAFVVHTTNPVTGSKDEIMGEVVVGLGEALVGNYPGRAMGFVVNKATGEAKVTHLPSKHTGVFLNEDTLIFRSDSNGEDLEGFAGAGLYESVMATKAQERPVDYSEEPLFWDEAFRQSLIKKIADAAGAVETVMGSAQDVEGCIVGDDVHVVQTRPQV